MKFILIIFVSYHVNGGVGAQTIQFETRADCIAAKAQIVEAFRATKRTAGYRAITTTCVKALTTYGE